VLNAPELTASAAKVAAVALLGSSGVQQLLGYVGEEAGILCVGLPRLLLLSALALWRSKTLISPGYALRCFNIAAQKTFVNEFDGSHDGRRQWVPPVLEDLAGAPWPVLRLVARLASTERARSPRLNPIVYSQGMLTSPGDGASSFGVQAQGFDSLGADAARQLTSTLQVAHVFLALAGVRYIAIAGTLLGAVRHFDRIPWDDDVDLCVDPGHEWKLASIVVAMEARQLSMDAMRELSWSSRRAMRFLDQQGHHLRVDSSRSLTFVVERASEIANSPAVDIWFCYGLADDSEEGNVILMSKGFGPKIPRSAVVPRRKLPFGSMAIWAPREPEEVLRHYLAHSGWSTNFRDRCRARKVHSPGTPTREFTDEVPCASLVGHFPICQPWRALSVSAIEGDNDTVLWVGVQMSFQSLFTERLPGFQLAGTVALEIAHCGRGWQPKLRAQVLVDAAGGRHWRCEALLWRAEDDDDDLLEAGLRTRGAVPVRSFICELEGSEETYIWEDTWAAT